MLFKPINWKKLHVANMINFLLIQSVNIPNPIHRTGSTIYKGKFSGVE